MDDLAIAQSIMQKMNLNESQQEEFKRGFSKGFREGIELNKGSLEREKNVYVDISVDYIKAQLERKDYWGLGGSYGFYIGLIENVLKYNNAYHFLTGGSNTERFILATKLLKGVNGVNLSYAKEKINSIDVNKFTFLNRLVSGKEQKKKELENNLEEIKKAF